MGDPVKSGKGTKDLLKSAEKLAVAGDTEKAFELFDACIREYLQKKMPFKALAAAKVAKTALGRHPRMHAMLIRILFSMGLMGDALREFSQSSADWKKDSAVILKKLTMDEFLDLLEIMEVIRIKKGSSIIEQGDKGEDIFIVLSGSLEVIRDGLLISTMHPGDVFGELGFFFHDLRSATVRAIRNCELARIPSQRLRELCSRRPGLMDSLEALYNARILKKASEDLKARPIIDLDNDILTTEHFIKGQQICFDSTTDVTIIKHGIVELIYDERGLQKKQFIRPGHILGHFSGTARASTDVEVIRARIDLLGSGEG
jgi:CRP-like cAMP-binding protein